MYKPVSAKVNFPDLEEEITKYWKKNKIFEKSIEFRPKDKNWTFLDGPPFVTGMPHYGSLLSSLPKDLFGRYWTMKGYRVSRVWGWDGHGLPIENKVEGKLKIERKRDIETKIGVKKFIDECKRYVDDVSDEWEWYVDRIGRWVDFKNAYKTWDIDYMESVMWVFKQMYDKGYVYKGLKVSMYCPHCSTPISNFEVAMDSENYKEVSDASTIYKYQLEGKNNTYILAWSTTPWNKIVTPALAVNPKLTYIKVKQGEEYYILAKSTQSMLHEKLPYKIIDEFKGAKLIGLRFTPHYDYYRSKANGKLFEIVGGDFVTAAEGTGVVTIAAYGEEDLKLMKEQGIHVEMHLDEEGMIKKEVTKFGGVFYLKANKLVNEDLAKRNLIYLDKDALHSVPLCWRCHTRLYYAPINAWYVDVQKLKPLMKSTNKKINWFPSHFKEGRFLKSLENAPDWNISRNRYWGSPVPVWECECGARYVPGSIKELEERSGQSVRELHKPDIDKIVVPCDKCGKNSHRVPEVLDSWIEAGSASFAERHFPFEESKLQDFFPPDFIAEYTGQIRAWFYVLHVIGAALYKSPAFKNVLVEGVILGTDGRKMSKNFKNYPDPRVMLDTYGADALRLYLLGSTVMHGEDILISEEEYRNQVRGTLLILWNTYNFFVTYANLDEFKVQNSEFHISLSALSGTGRTRSTPKINVLDEWIYNLLNQVIIDTTKSLESYDTASAIDYLKSFISDFSTWYIRRCRGRVGPMASDRQDKREFYYTCRHVLKTLALLFAPMTPFIAEEIYRNLTGEESVHLADWPKPEQHNINDQLLAVMKSARSLVEQVHAIRKKHQLKVRQPLARLGVLGIDAEERGYWVRFEGLLKDELNVKAIEYLQDRKIPKGKHIIMNTMSDGLNKTKMFFVDTELTSQLIAEGEAREIIRSIQVERKKLGMSLLQQVEVMLPKWPEEFEDEIKRRTLATRLIKGTEFKIHPVKSS